MQVDTIVVAVPAGLAERLCRECGELGISIPSHILPHTMRGTCWYSTMLNEKVQEGNITDSDTVSE